MQGREEVAGGGYREPQPAGEAELWPTLQGKSGGLCSTNDGEVCAVTAVCGAATPSACHLEEWEAAWSQEELRVGDPSASSSSCLLPASLCSAIGQASWAQVLSWPESWPQGAAGSGTKEGLKLGHSEHFLALL